MKTEQTTSVDLRRLCSNKGFGTRLSALPTGQDSLSALPTGQDCQRYQRDKTVSGTNGTGLTVSGTNGTGLTVSATNGTRLSAEPTGQDSLSAEPTGQDSLSALPTGQDYACAVSPCSQCSKILQRNLFPFNHVSVDSIILFRS